MSVTWSVMCGMAADRRLRICAALLRTVHVGTRGVTPHVGCRVSIPETPHSLSALETGRGRGGVHGTAHPCMHPCHYAIYRDRISISDGIYYRKFLLVSCVP